MGELPYSRPDEYHGFQFSADGGGGWDQRQVPEGDNHVDKPANGHPVEHLPFTLEPLPSGYPVVSEGGSEIIGDEEHPNADSSQQPGVTDDKEAETYGMPAHFLMGEQPYDHDFRFLPPSLDDLATFHSPESSSSELEDARGRIAFNTTTTNFFAELEQRGFGVTVAGKDGATHFYRKSDFERYGSRLMLEHIAQRMPERGPHDAGGISREEMHEVLDDMLKNDGRFAWAAEYATKYKQKPS